MLKEILTQLHGNEAFLLATLATTGHLDVNASPERAEAVLAEIRSELEAAGIEAPVAASAPAPGGTTMQVDGAKAAPAPAPALASAAAPAPKA